MRGRHQMWQILPGRKGPLRPMQYAIALTFCFVGLSVAAFYVLDRTLEYFLGRHLAQLLDHMEWDTALPYLAVSSLLFLFACVWLLRHLDRNVRALEQAASDRLQAEERASLGALSASVIHDCNNMLTVVQGNADMLERFTPMLGPDGGTYLTQLENALKRLSGLIGLFLKYATAPERRVSYDLVSTARECLELVRHHPAIQPCGLQSRLAGSVPMEGNLLLVWSALTNLVLNAAEATGPGGQIEVRLARAEDAITIEVHDNGPGVPPADRRRIFEPFHTGKADGHGLGLLAVTRCMEAHRGHVDVVDSPLGGACFRLHFPGLPVEEVRAQQPAPALDGV